MRTFNGIQPYNALWQLTCINQVEYKIWRNLFCSLNKNIYVEFLDTEISPDEIEQFLQSCPNLTRFEIKDLHGYHDMNIADGYR